MIVSLEVGRGPELLITCDMGVSWFLKPLT